MNPNRTVTSTALLLALVACGDAAVFDPESGPTLGRAGATLLDGSLVITEVTEPGLNWRTMGGTQHVGNRRLAGVLQGGLEGTLTWVEFSKYNASGDGSTWVDLDVAMSAIDGQPVNAVFSTRLTGQLRDTVLAASGVLKGAGSAKGRKFQITVDGRLFLFETSGAAPGQEVKTPLPHSYVLTATPIGN